MWEKIDEDLWAFSDSCIVYALKTPQGVLLFNAGTGAAADALVELAGDLPVHVLLTHYFRDHSAGADRFKAGGARIYAPYWEHAYYEDPEQHFRERQVWNSYDNRWDRFSPLTPIEVDEWMMDYATREIAGVNVYIEPSPGVSSGGVSYIVEHGGRRLAFVGELIQAPGKIARLAPLQYNYNDCPGACAVYYSCAAMLRQDVDMLLPSLGKPIDTPRPALESLRQNLLTVDGVKPGIADQMAYLDCDDDLIEFIPGRLYKSKYSVCATNFLISKSGKAMCLDYGYGQIDIFPEKYHFANRRALLHGVRGLKSRFGIDRIDTCLVSHFHDDHVNGINLIRRLYGTKVLACENFADILENPMAYDRPCLWEEPIPVDQRLPAAEPVQWEEFTITCYPMSGHTRFAAILCIEFDDERLCHTGDQVFFYSSKAGLVFVDDGSSREFVNQVYKNGLDMGCYKASLDVIKNFDPTWLATGHTDPYPVAPIAERFYKVLEAGAAAFDDVHATLMPLADDDVHFGAESQPAKLCPYHCHHAEAGGQVELWGWVLNPFNKTATAEVNLALPDGWTAAPVTLDLGPREQARFTTDMTVSAGTVCRRLPIGLELTVDNKNFGQVSEALVTVGCPHF